MSGAHRRTSRASLVLLQLLVFVTYIFGPTATFAEEPTPEPPTESAAPAVSPDPTTEPTPDPTLVPTDAPTPTQTPDSTAAPSESAVENVAGPTISSDKEDYAPGELVTLIGSNWAPGEVVHIRVNDDQGESWRRDVDVIAGIDGRIADQFNLPAWFVAKYFVTASGPTSGLAHTTFTDGNVKVASAGGVHFNYTVTPYPGSANCTGTPASPAIKTADANGSTTGVGNNESLLITANLDANTPNASATFSNWTVGSIVLAAGSAATNRTICVVGFQSGSRDLIGNYATNAAPVCANDSGSTNEDVTLIDTLGCSDANGNPLTYSRVANATHGNVTVSSDGSFSYVPTANFNGTDSFTFKANDGNADSNTATYSITVNPVNDAPTCDNDSGTVDEDETLNDAVSCLDIDGDTLTSTIVDDVEHGSLTLHADGSFSYVPTANFNGTDSFTFKANDGNVDSNTATYSITVTAVNDAPVCANDSGSTDEDTILNDILVCSDADADALSYAVSDSVASGALSLAANGSFSYIPNANFNGSDGFSFRASDGLLNSNLAGYSITINPVNDAPLAVHDGYATDEDTQLDVLAVDGVLVNDSDIEGDSLIAVLDTDVANGSLTLHADGSFSYLPDANFNGTDTFTYHVNDGELDSNIVTVTITINPVNDAPTCDNDSGTVDEDETLNDAVSCLDIDGDTLTSTIVDDVEHGSLTLHADGSFSYVPTANFNGTDSFTFKANDGNVDSNTATYSITVTAVNDAPVVSVIGQDAANEGDTKTYEFVVTEVDTDDTFVVVLVDCSGNGAQIGITVTTATGGSFDCKFTDGLVPTQNSTVRVQVKDASNADSNVAELRVTVVNVAPAVTAATVTWNQFNGEVSSSFSYNDPGALDRQTATFRYTINGVVTETVLTDKDPVATVADKKTLSPGCYTIQVEVFAVDKDAGESNHEVRSAGAGPLDFYRAEFRAPIKANERNIAKYGNVVPMKVDLLSMCIPGTTVTAPVLHITIADGNAMDAQPDSTPAIIAESVSNADTGTQMRGSGGSYIYNFSTKQLAAGQDYTLRIRVGSTIGTIVARALVHPKR